MFQIKGKVVAKRNVIVHHTAFFTAKQGPLESIDGYAARLKRLAQVSKLGTLESELITYKIVTTNTWQHLRTKMRKIANITLEEALDICRAEEIANDQSQDKTVVQGSKFNKQKQRWMHPASHTGGHIVDRRRLSRANIMYAIKTAQQYFWINTTGLRRYTTGFPVTIVRSS